MNADAWKGLKHLYPNADPERDYTLTDFGDGAGSRLTHWNAVLGPKPTDKQINDAVAAYDTAAAAAAATEAAEESAIDTMIAALEAGTNLTAAQTRRLQLYLVRRAL